MTAKVLKVDLSTSLLEACRVMNNEGYSGVIVFQGDKVVGMMTDRSLLRRFVPLNREPDEVKVSDVMGSLLKIDPETSAKEATRKIVENRFTRLGVFDDNRLLGYVTVTDLAKEISKRTCWRHFLVVVN
jgi:CBS domain-containing protein